ncbi:unnamed protein product [Pleuronectes platessa]|uniref:C2H2-type domain-containing protein n=1 Tax=Pleuronectes platessa TaxID=8262 RepID=A0A9N7UAR7_PLEPL|nr:unnamed protein product [Pleuronectes platessa]
MRTHTEEKRFSCNVCDKRFTCYTQLKTHKCVGASSLRHNKLRTKLKESFSCSRCGTPQPEGNLKTHERIHGEKPISCSLCGSSFTHIVHLSEHVTEHTVPRLWKRIQQEEAAENTHVCLNTWRRPPV